MVRKIVVFALWFMPLAVEARSLYRGGGGVEGPAAWVIGGPLYWFIARYYLDKLGHKLIAGALILGVSAVNGPFGMVASVLGILAGYWIYWPFTQTDHIKNKELGGVLVLGNVVATAITVFLVLEPLARTFPTRW